MNRQLSAILFKIPLAAVLVNQHELNMYKTEFSVSHADSKRSHLVQHLTVGYIINEKAHGI